MSDKTADSGADATANSSFAPDASILSPALIDGLKKAGTVRALSRGDVLILHGSKADAFYIVLHGRFSVFYEGRAIAEISAGEPIGEIAFFAGGRRTATVSAARASEVVEITRDAYDAIVEEVPELSAAILRALADRVRAGVPMSRPLAPRGGQVIGVYPAAGGTLEPNVVAGIADALARRGKVRHLTPDLLGSGQSVAEWISSHDDPETVLLLSSPDPAVDEGWASEVFENTDTALLVLDPKSPVAETPSDLESRISDVFLAPNVHLAILQSPGQSEISGTAALLQDRTPGLHHHIRSDNNADMDRLARFLTGEALGVVFGGGGAFGTAHLGLLKALGEHGFAFDMIGGASIGTAMGAGYAMGLSPDEVLDRCEEMFLKSRAMRRLTVPYYSIIDHAHFDKELRRQFGDRRIEDLPLNLFAVATSLTRNDLAVLRRGELWRAVRASSSIPAVFPPMVMEDGEVMIDGAFIDNVPVETMRQLKPGRNLVLSLEQKKDWRVDTPYDTLPGRGSAVRRMILGPLARRVRFPGIFSVMTRSMIVNSERRLSAADHGRDIFLPIQPIKGMGFLQWDRGRELFDATYARTADALEAEAARHSGEALLRAAARRVAEAD